MDYISETMKQLSTYFSPAFTLLVVFSVLMIFMQLRFPLKAKQMLFIGAFTMLLTFQLAAIQNKFAAAFGFEVTSSNTIKVYIVYIIQAALIIWGFIKEKNNKK